MSDIVRLSVIGTSPNAVHLAFEAMQEAGSFVPIVPSFLLSAIQELHPDDLGISERWHADPAAMVRLARDALAGTRLLAAEHYPGTVDFEAGHLPRVEVEIGLRRSDWLADLRAGTRQTSALFPSRLRRSAAGLAEEAPSTKEALGRLAALARGPVLEEVGLAEVRSLLFHPSDGVVKRALVLLMRAGTAAVSLLPEIAELTLDWDRNVQATAIGCLGELGVPAAGDVLCSLLGTEDDCVVWPALQALARLPEPSPAWVPAVRAVGARGDARRAQRALWTEWRCTGDLAVLANYATQTLRDLGTTYLWRDAPPSALPALADALVDAIQTAPAVAVDNRNSLKHALPTLGAEAARVRAALKQARA